MAFSIYSFIFLFGLAIGSFLNCLIYRLEREESFLKGRSYCPHCQHSLGWRDLIPVLSFFILKGKCRYCRKPISWQYPLVEIFTGIIFLAILNNFAVVALSGIYYFIIACFLIVIFVYDLKHYIIPDKVVCPAIAIALLYRLFNIWNFGRGDLFLIWNLGFGILPSLFFLAIILLSRERWMGMGDFKLGVLLGLILGWPHILVALFLSFFVGAAVGTGLIVSGRKKMKSEVPFGPFLVAGAFLTMFFGRHLVDWYTAFFLLK